jgi:GDP-L-fucose synthase
MPLDSIEIVETVYIAGHSGLVGSALVRAIEKRGLCWVGQRHSELDLLDRDSVFSYIGDTKPDTVIIAAARVGGIIANDSSPVEFLSENIRISTNIIDACHHADIQKVLFLGSSCIYPRMAPQPIKEEYLLTGPLEPTNESYALAKISGLKLIQAYRRQYGRNWISAMPTNLYGPGDNFDLQSSHVLPATIRKFATAVTSGASVVEMWGTGTPRREFLHVDDLASACLHLLENYNDDLCINVGTGVDIEIRELASLVSEIVGYTGEIVWNTQKPDGMPKKLLDVTRIKALGWQSQIPLHRGLQEVFEWYKANVDISKMIE